jgi:hypothetical protein
MTYYLTVIAQSEKDIPASEIQKWLDFGFIDPCEEEENWAEMYVCASEEEGSEIAQVHKYSVGDGDIADSILEKFTETMDKLMPISARLWVSEQIRATKVVYSFLIINKGFFSGELEANRWKILNSVCFGMLQALGGILHQEDAGFLNADGVYVTLEPEIGDNGEIEVAILQGEMWKNFAVDLSNFEHKKAFLNGEIPIN